MESDEELLNKQYRQSVPALGRLWTRRVKSVSGGIEKPLTSREFGQLKLLSRALGDLTDEVITFAVDNWERVCLKARYDCGLPSNPVIPHIGFLLAHHSVVINLMYTNAKAKQTKSDAEISLIKRIDRLMEQEKKRWAAPIPHSVHPHDAGDV
jgi:hypothetical protein